MKMRRRAATGSSDPVATGRAPAPKRKPNPLPEVKGPALPKGWSRAADTLERIQAVQTIFPGFNLATRVGGLPIKRVTVVHGPTHGGKTAFLVGLVKSFVDAGHWGAYIDAERTLGEEFARELMGPSYELPNFLASRPDSYEETVTKADDFLNHVIKLRKDNPNLCSILAVDSINKLQPERELQSILKEGAKEMAKGHQGRYRASVNQSWLDHLGPRLEKAGCALVVIAQERQKQAETGAIKKKGGHPLEHVNVKGGAALQYDSSLLVQVSKSIAQRDPPTKEGKIVGFHYRVRIYKSKVGHMEGHWTDTAFHMSNGVLTAPGFDLARDAVHIGRNLDMIKTNGSWLTWRKRRWQGESRAVAAIAKAPQLLHELMVDINARINADAGKVFAP